VKVLSETGVRDYGIKIMFLQLKPKYGSKSTIELLAETFFRSEDRIRSIIYKEKPTARDLKEWIDRINTKPEKTLEIPFKEWR